MMTVFKVDKAVEFIKIYGNDYQQLLLRYLTGSGDTEQLQNCFARHQNHDGGWAAIDADYVGHTSSVTCTMLALRTMCTHSLTNSSAYERTLIFLTKRQKNNGMWDESGEILKYSIPQWYLPKTRINQIWITNGIVRYLWGRDTENIDLVSAKQFLRSCWTSEGFPGYDHNNWMGLVSFHSMELDLDREIQLKCYENIRNQIRNYDLADVVWAMESCHDTNLPADDPVVQMGLEIILAGQSEDGGGVTSYGNTHRVDTTLEALAILKKYKIINL